jgi:superoxide dismutase
MMLHHGKDHASYVEKLNTALEIYPDLQQKVALRLLLNVGKLPRTYACLMQVSFPLLLNDAWERTCYLKHENPHADYLNGWWPVVNWQEAALRYERSDHSAEQRRGTVGGNRLKAAG